MTRASSHQRTGAAGLRRHDRARQVRFGTIAADVDPTRHPGSPDQFAAVRGDPAAFRGVLRRARPHRRPERQPRARRRPDAALHELRDGPVQGRPDRRGEAQLHAGGRLPAGPAGRRQAQRLRGGRPDAAPPHAVRDARQLELRRLLQARGDPLRVGLPDPRPRDPGGPTGGDDLHDRRPRLRRLARRDRPARRTGSCAGATSPTATRRTGGGWPTSGRAARAARSTSIAARTCQRGPRVRARPQRDLPALARDLEPRVHGVRARTPTGR